MTLLMRGAAALGLLVWAGAGVSAAIPITTAQPSGHGPENAPWPLWREPLLDEFVVTGPFRAPEHQYASGHRGIDVRASVGEFVVAPLGGTVSFVGTVVDREVLTIQSDDGAMLVSFEPVRAVVRVGDHVRADELLGEVSSGGHCAAECVHIGVRVNGEYVNPLRFFVHRPRLVAW